MSKQSRNKFFLPVELSSRKPVSWLNLTYYEYKIYADDKEDKFTKIKFTDIDGFIIGAHMPTKLNTFYDKAVSQAKAGTVKAVNEIKSVVDNVADIAVAAAKEVSGNAKTTAGVAGAIFGKVKSFAKDRFTKSEAYNVKSDETTNKPE